MTFWFTSCGGRCVDLPGCARPCDGFTQKGPMPDEWEPDHFDNPEIYSGRVPPIRPKPYRNGKEESTLADAIRLPPDNGLWDKAGPRSASQNSNACDSALPLPDAHDISLKDKQAAGYEAYSFSREMKAKIDALEEVEKALVDPRTGLAACPFPQQSPVFPPMLHEKSASNGRAVEQPPLTIESQDSRGAPTPAVSSTSRPLPEEQSQVTEKGVLQNRAYQLMGHSGLVKNAEATSESFKTSPRAQLHSEPSSPSHSMGRHAGQDHVDGHYTDGSEDWRRDAVTSSATLQVRPDDAALNCVCGGYPQSRSVMDTSQAPQVADAKQPPPEKTDRFSFLRERLPLWSHTDPEAEQSFFFFEIGLFMKNTRAPNGQTWGDYCGPSDPGETYPLKGPWAECIHAAVVHEHSHTKWKEDPEIGSVAPTQQVFDYFEACGHSEQMGALEEAKLATLRQLQSCGASGISSSRGDSCSPRSSICPSSSRSRQSRVDPCMSRNSDLGMSRNSA